MVDFYNPQNILSYNAMLNMVLGARAIGKTYAFKRYCIDRCIGTGRKFIYLRRYKTEVNSQKMQSFFNDINNKYYGRLSCKNNIFYYDKEVLGYAIPLSTYVSLKGVVYNDVDYVIFDEFLIQEGCYRYLQNEFDTFCEFLATLSRFDNNGKMRKIKVFMLSNAISFVNPYFANFGIDLSLNFKGILRVNEQTVVEVNSNQAFHEQIAQTDLYKALKDTSYTEYAYGNNTLCDTEDFIAERPKGSQYFATVLYEGKQYGIWRGNNENGTAYYLCRGYDKTHPVKLYVDRADNREQYYRVKDMKALMPYITNTLKLALQTNVFYYETQLLKDVGEQLYKTLC